MVQQAVVADLIDEYGGEVLVVAGRPRYHREGCRHVVARPADHVDVRDALEDGYTPCGTCRPDDALLVAAETEAAAEAAASAEQLARRTARIPQQAGPSAPQQLIAAPATAPAWAPSEGQQFSAPGFDAPPPVQKQPTWRRKRVMIPAGIVAFFFVVGALGGGDDSTEVRQAASSSAPRTVDQAPVPVDPAAAADKAAADKAAADKAAADKAAADKAAADKAAADKAAAERAAKGPAEQQALLQAVVTGRSGYEATDNELKQRQAQAVRSEALRAAVPSLDATEWVGTIRSIDTNGEGKAVLELAIGDDTKVSTWNNAFSDLMDNTLIPMDSPMYETLVNLEEGDKVKFSGTFFKDSEQGLKESSLTFNGQMMTPNFVFKFSSISPLG